MAEATAALAAESVVREFGEGESAVRAVNEVTVNISPGEFVALVGRSGSGKTTLLNLLAGLDRPSSGKVWFEGRELSGWWGDQGSGARDRLHQRRASRLDERQATAHVGTGPAGDGRRATYDL